MPAQAGQPLPPELALIPHDAAAVTTARPRAILARLPASETKADESHDLFWLMSVLVGVAVEDIERVTVIVPPDDLPPAPKDVKDGDKRPHVTPDPGSVFDVPPEVRYRTVVLTTRRALPRLPYQALGGVVTPTTRAGRTATHRGRAFALDDDGWTAWLKVGERTVVFGTRASVEWVIDQLTGHAKPGPLGPLIWATRDHDIASMVRPVTGREELPSDILLLSDDPRGQALATGFNRWFAGVSGTPASRPDAVAVGVDLSADRVELHTLYPTERAAERQAASFSALRKEVLERAAEHRDKLLTRDADAEQRRDAARLDTLTDLLKPLDKPAVAGRAVSAALPGLARPSFADPDFVRVLLQGLYGLPMHSSSTFDPGVDHHTFREAHIARALGAYHTKHGRYPDAALTDGDGKPLLSWRVALLPFLGHEKLHARFKLNEPWNSTHNAKLLDEIPWPYSDGHSRRFRHRPVTHVHLPVGPGTLFEGGTGRRKADATDGADQTVLLLTLDRAVPWTQPTDATVAPGKPLKVGGEKVRLQGFTTADGKARHVALFVRLGGEFDLAPLLTRAGGEPKLDIDGTLSAAALAAGHHQLDLSAMFERMLKTAGDEIPKGLERPKAP